jgi:hypothetical protein
MNLTDKPGANSPNSGKLSLLPSVTISRESPPSEEVARTGDVIYNVRSATEVIAAFTRRPRTSGTKK